MIKLPQDTSLGKLTQYDVSMLKRELLSSGELKYGMRTKNEMKIIIGKDSIEEDIPVFQYPYMLDETLLVDVRPFVKDSTKYQLEDIINLRLEFSIPLVMGMLIDNKDLSQFKQLYIKAIQVIVGGRLKNSLNLSISDSLVLNNILAVYATNNITDYDNLDACVGVAQQNIIGETLHENDIKEYINGKPLNTISDLCEVLNNIEDLSRTLRSITEEIVYDSVGGTVFTTNRLVALIGLESPYAFLAIIFAYLNNPLYKKTGIVYSLSVFNSVLGLEHFTKNIKQMTKEYSISNLF